MAPEENIVNRNVLLVDDVDLFLEIEKKFLEGKGLLVHTAHDGIEAIEAARKIRPALIIMDNFMPRMNGDAACRQLKSDVVTREIPVLMVTANSSSEAVEECFRAGADMVITKPLRRDELLASIDKLTDLKLSPVSMLPKDRPTVLVIEDSAFFVTLLKDTLSARGYDVMTASSSSEAEERLGAYGRFVHLVLLDLIMPSQSGPDILRRIRAVPDAEKIPVVALTSVSPLDPLAAEARSLGVTEFINKAIPPTDLLYRIDELMFAESSDTRRDPRYSLHVPVQFKTDRHWIMGETVNISKNGLCIRSLELPEPNAEIVLKFNLPDVQNPCEEQASVVWVSIPDPQKSQKLLVLDSGFGVVLEFRSEEFKEGFEAIEARYRLG